ncbi:MAG TPA: hypothetical protein VN820_06645 [Acidimicrobiales bacterium]|nr:hypothetical protein [Acidimicrobiales bacterium]
MTIDIDSLIQRSGRLQVDDIDFEAFRRHPLDPATLRCLRYMHDVEGHTACYLRDLLVTRAHRDPEVTAFLACWCYEEHWHGEAIADVLRAHDEPAGRSRLAESRRHLPRRDALRPLAFTLGSALTPHIVAVHMAWGAVNEWTTQAGYGRLAAKADHPVLSELLRRIMRQEGRHIDFYALGARRRLADSATARRITRFALRRYWAPVGAGVMPDPEVQFLVNHLFGDAAGRAGVQRIDRLVGRLPGLEGLHLVESALDDLTAAAPHDLAARAAQRQSAQENQQEKEQRHAC